MIVGGKRGVLIDIINLGDIMGYLGFEVAVVVIIEIRRGPDIVIIWVVFQIDILAGSGHRGVAPDYVVVDIGRAVVGTNVESATGTAGNTEVTRVIDKGIVRESERIVDEAEIRAAPDTRSVTVEHVIYEYPPSDDIQAAGIGVGVVVLEDAVLDGQCPTAIRLEKGPAARGILVNMVRPVIEERAALDGDIPTFRADKQSGARQ